MTKKLYRSTTQKVIGGVCGGIAEYFNIDPVIVRILFVVSLFGWGASFLVYILALIIIPKREINYYTTNSTSEGAEFSSSFESNDNYTEDQDYYAQNEQIIPNKSRKFFGLALIIIGSIFLFDDFFEFLEFEMVFPIVLILAGAYILFPRKGN